MIKKKVFIVDDEESFTHMVTRYLESTDKYKVISENDSTKAVDAIKKMKPDIVLLDIMMPVVSGQDICGQLRNGRATSAIPVIMVSAKSDVSDKVSLLAMGADDYLEKPFSLEELDARISAVLRRSSHYAADKKIGVGDVLEIDPVRHEVTVSGMRVELTPAEFLILSLLSSEKGRAFTRAEMLKHLWGHDKTVTERAIDVHIVHLRAKLGEAGGFIKNVRSIGYKVSET